MSGRTKYSYLLSPEENLKVFNRARRRAGNDLQMRRVEARDYDVFLKGYKEALRKAKEDEEKVEAQSTHHTYVSYGQE